MRYLISSTYYYPYISGITMVIKRLSEYLRQNNHSVNIIQAKPNFRIGKGIISLEWYLKCPLAVWQNDTVIINLPQFEGWWAAFWAKIFNKRIICIYHCEVSFPIYKHIMDVSSFITLTLSDKIVTYTKDYAEHSRVLKYFWGKLTFAYPPIPRPHKISRPKHSQFTLGVAARLSHEKGIEYLLEAIQDIDCKLLLVGPLDPVGEKAYHQKIMQLVKNVQHKVTFLGRVEKIEEFYAQIDLLILPSINSTEAFGLVQLEAMYHKIPVIASNLPGVRVAIQKTGMGIIVPPQNPAAIKKAILKIKNNYHDYVKAVGPEFEMYANLRKIIS